MIFVYALGLWAAIIAGYDIRQQRIPNAALILVLVPASLALIFQGQGMLGDIG